MSTSITKIKRVANGRLQAEMKDHVEKPTTKTNVLAKLNRGDSAFKNVSKQRYGWFGVTVEGLSDMGVSEKDIAAINKLAEGESFELNLDSPTLFGDPLRLQIIETTDANEYEQENVLTKSKQITITEDMAKRKNVASDYDLSDYIGEQGYFLTTDGRHVFARAQVTIESELQHVFLNDAKLVPESDLQEFSVTLADATRVKEQVEEGVEDEI